MRTALALAVLVLAPALAAGHELGLDEPTLPKPRYGMVAFHDGTHVYAAGGGGMYGDGRFFRIDPATGTVEALAATLPGGHYYSAAAADGARMFVFGGDGADPQDLVATFDPATGAVSTSPERLPYPVNRASAVWDPRATAACPSGCAYVFGGQWYDRAAGRYVYYDRILRYDPAGDRVDVMGARLPEARFYTAAAFDGARAWIVGGQDSGWRPRAEIFVYDPLADAVRTSPAKLPHGNFIPSAAFVGGLVHVFGGRGAVDGQIRYFDTVFAVDPVAETVTELDLVLPTERFGMAAATSGPAVWLVAGYGNGAGTEVLRFDLGRSPPPEGVAAVSGPGEGEITVSWSAPPHDDQPTAYRVYRDGALLAEVTGAAFLDATPTPGVLSTYRVSAVNAAGEGLRSPASGAYPLGVPAAPSSPAAKTGPGAGEITVTWKAPPSDGGRTVSAYRVYGGDSGAPAALLAEVAATATSWRDAGLAAGQARTYHVTAVNGAGESPPTADVGASAPVPPGAPRGLTARAGLLPGQISVRWSAPLSDGGTAVLRYEVWRAGQDGAFAKVAEVDRTEWIDGPRAHGVPYRYRVAAVNGVGPGALSAEASGSAIAPLAYKVQSGPGGLVVFDDRDDDNQVDDGEAVASVPALP